jgi:hypoxanthine phosphoribosyltransferase
MSDIYAEVVAEATIADRVAELGAEIANDYEGRDLMMVGILHGSLPFLSDLSRHLPPSSVDLDFMALTRFGEEGRVSIAMDTASSMEGRHVLLVEDIVDTGLTLSTLRKLFEARDLASLAVATLLDKAPRRIVDVPLEYRGFEVGDEFLLGYGLDYHGKYRNLRSLWAVLDLAGFQAEPLGLAERVFATAGDSLSA